MSAPCKAVRLVAYVSAPCRNTALHLASWSGHTGSVKALLEKGAAVNAKDNAKCAFSFLLPVLDWRRLHAPARPCAVRLVVVSVSAPYRWTALHDASSNGHTESVKALLEKGAAVNSKDSSGKTAFHVAKDRRAYIAAVEVRCVRTICHAKAGQAAGTATRMIHVVLQAASASKVRRPRACSALSVPAARSTAAVFGGHWLARLLLLAVCGTAAGRG